MFTILIRAIILYIIMIIAMRSMGKRQLGQFQPFEFAMTIMIADILSTPMSDVSTPLFHGVLPVAAMVSVHALITLLCLKSDRARSVISGKPSVLIHNGIIQSQELNRLCLSLADLLEGVRESGILDINDVQYAIMEADGTITAFPCADKRPPNNEDMNIHPEIDVLPLAIIMDGRIQIHNLDSSCLNKENLIKELSKLKLSVSDVLLGTLSKNGTISLSLRNGSKSQINIE